MAKSEYLSEIEFVAIATDFYYIIEMREFLLQWRGNHRDPQHNGIVREEIKKHR